MQILHYKNNIYKILVKEISLDVDVAYYSYSHNTALDIFFNSSESRKFLKNNCINCYINSTIHADSFIKIFRIIIEIEDKKLTEYYLKLNEE